MDFDLLAFLALFSKINCENNIEVYTSKESIKKYGN